MGIFDRFGRSGQSDDRQGRTFEAQRVEPSEDEQALARYRYMLRTAPPEAIEQAHAEAFARLTPQQRRLLLEQLLAGMPENERAYAADNPQALARLATRAEVRQPGTMERVFSQAPPAAGLGFGGVMASSLFGSLAGTVLGTAIAQHFFGGHGGAGHGLFDSDQGIGHHDAETAPYADADGTDVAGSLDNLGPGFDGDSFDV
jgi:hypothetical protein